MKIMAVDVGEARTGVAISDPTASVIGTTLVVQSYNPDKAVAALAELITAQGVGALIVGLPRNTLDGSEGERARLCRDFAGKLERAAGMPVLLWDEWFTTVDAHRILTDCGRHGKRRRQTIDAVAASLILESYLDFLRRA